MVSPVSTVVQRVDPTEINNLIPLICLGDEHAFAELYDLTSDRVLALIKSVVCDTGHAEEVTQEVYLELWRSAARFDCRKGNAIAWIMVIARNRAIDRVRSAQASTIRTRSYAVRNFERHADAADGALKALEYDKLEHALAGLSFLQREAIGLSFMGGLTYPEVSRQLGVPLATIKTRIRDGLRRLKIALAETN